MNTWDIYTCVVLIEVNETANATRHEAVTP